MVNRRPRAFLAALALVIAWLVIGGIAGPLAGQLTDVQKNNNAAYLPSSAEATKVLKLQEKFQDQDVFPAVIVYHRTTGIRPADRAEATTDANAIKDLPNVVGAPSPAIPSEDGKALQVVVQVAAGDGNSIGTDIQRIRDVAHSRGGLTVNVTGPAGQQADLVEVFESIDTTLLAVTGLVVIVILLLIYRSPFLWIAPLLAAGMSLALSQAVIYLLAKHAGLTVNGQSQGILTVLVFGAGTDYALLLTSRYREELRQHESKYAAMRRAMAGAVWAILASGVTVILGLLCLLLSELASNQSLGPVTAVGIACTLLVMLTFLPAVLLLGGRALFWPFVPRFGSAQQETSGLWGRIARLVSHRSRVAWIGATLLLVALATFAFQLKASGLSSEDSFTTTPESVQGQRLLGEHFPAGSGNPAVIVGKADRVEDLVAAARGTEGIASASPVTDSPLGSGAPEVVDGLVEVDAVLGVDPDGAQGADVIKRLRTAVHAVPEGDALVGGFTAVELDVQDASQRDRTLIIPIVLLVIFVVLALLLRALLAPLLLIATVVLSFLATLGVCALVFNQVFDFAGGDSSFPLFTFVFLVALGIDYNIFLMSRVREETLNHGTRPGILKGLAVTGGVITSAGIVLAATFAALGVLPLVFLVELGFAVAFGVLMDTLLVRSILVPALAYDIGSRIWWPSRLARVDDVPVAPVPAPLVLQQPVP